MITRSLRSACVAGPSRIIAQRRAIATAVPLLRQNDRVPTGHVRPRRSRIARQVEPAEVSDFNPPPAFADARPAQSSLVVVPSDPNGVLTDNHGARELLANDALVIVRQIEMMNVFLGYEQANRYAIQNSAGELVGFLAEEETSMLGVLARQTLRTHRPFKATIMDKTGQPVLWIRRPFQFINSKMFVHAAEGAESRLVGETQQEWHPWRRRYNVFQSKDEEAFKQFARIDSGLLAWDFWLKDKDDRLVASINRNFRGLGRELFTDTGQYVIRFDSAGTELDLPPGADVTVQGQSLVLPEAQEGGLTLDQRAMALATAVSIDFDYFSRHSGSGGFGLPFMMWGGGDGSSDVNHGRGGDNIPPGEIPGGPGIGGMAGAAGAGAIGGRGMSENEEIYGQPSNSSDSDLPRRPAGEDVDVQQGTGRYDDDGQGLEGFNEDQGWIGEQGEEVMQDPWGPSAGGDDSGWFGGGGGDGGGDWGDWS